MLSEALRMAGLEVNAWTERMVGLQGSYDGMMKVLAIPCLATYGI